MVSSVTMSGCPGWPSHLPVMTESLCFRCLHVTPPMWQTKTWPTCLGDPDGRVTSLSWPSPSASGVSMCHSSCGKPKHDWQWDDLYIKDISGFNEKSTSHYEVTFTRIKMDIRAGQSCHVKIFNSRHLLCYLCVSGDKKCYAFVLGFSSPRSSCRVSEIIT